MAALGSSPDALFHAMETMPWLAPYSTRNSQQADKANEKVWNGLMTERAVAYFDTAFFAPARKYFPNVRGSNWYYRKYTPDYCIPDGYTNMPCFLEPSSTSRAILPAPDVGYGAVVGGDALGFSTCALYNHYETKWRCKRLNESDCKDYGMAAVLRERFGVQTYPDTAFNIARVSTLQVRGMVLGGMAQNSSHPVEVKPWIAWHNYSWGKVPSPLGRGPWNGSLNSHGMRIGFPEMDYWQEVLLHAVVSGVGQFLYFNIFFNN